MSHRLSLSAMLLMCSAVPGVAQPDEPARAQRIQALFGMDEAAFEKELERRFQYPAPKPPGVVVDERAGQALDAAHFRRFPELDRSYSPAARAQALRLADELERDARTLTHEQFVLRVAEITALADNSHTAISEDALRKGTPRLPIRTMLFAEGLFVLRAAPGHEDLLGARIDSIEDRSTQSVFAGLVRYRAGLEAHRRLMLVPVLESPTLLQAAGLARDSGSLSIGGVLADGTAFERTIAAEQRDRAAPVSNTMRLLFPSTANAKMRSYLSSESKVPVYLRSSSDIFTIHELPLLGLYVGMGHNGDSDDLPLKVFLQGVLDRVRRDKPAFVVLDMRMNSGGDYTKSYDFARALPDAAAGAPIYVITSPWTFSAAITTVAALKQAGGAQVTIVGEPVGDRLAFWAEGGAVQLPNSGITAFYAAGRHDYSDPCVDRSTCFWLNELYPVRVKSLAPDIPVSLTFAAYREGRDPAMEAILRDLKQQGERG